jgi:hypothetical protein
MEYLLMKDAQSSHSKSWDIPENGGFVSVQLIAIVKVIDKKI